MKRVVITGAGTINALAHDVKGTFAALAEGRCGITELDIRDRDSWPSASAGRCMTGTPRRISTASRSR